MADKRLTDVDPLVSFDDADQLHVVDVSDTTDDPAGTSKRSAWSLIKSTLKTYFDTLYSNVSEWVTFSGTRLGGNLTVRIGDYDDSNNGTGIEISDAARNVKLGDTQENQNGTILEVDDSNGNVNLIAPAGKASIQTSTFDINLSGETAPTVGQVLKVKSLDGSTATINFQDESGGGGDSYVNYKTSCRATMNTTNWFGINRDYSTQVYNWWLDTGTTTELNVYNNTTLSTATVSWFTAPFDLEIERIILNIENERTFTIQFSIGSCDRADGGSTVNNPTTLYTSGNLVKSGTNWFKQELTTADFGTLSVSQGDCVIPLLKKVSGDSSILRVNNFEIICKKV